MSFWRSSGVDMSVETSGKGCPKRTNGILGGGFKFSPLLGEDSHFDYIIFFRGG